MLGPLDDDGEHTWAVVLGHGHGHGSYYDVLDAAGLYLDPDIDPDIQLDAPEDSLLEAKTFLDSASSVTRPPSLSSSHCPGAFLLSRSTSGATTKTSRASAARTSSNTNPSFIGSDERRALQGFRFPFSHEPDRDDTPPLPALPFATVARSPMKPSKSLQLDLGRERERGRLHTAHSTDDADDRRDHQLRLFDQYLLPEQRPITSRSLQTTMPSTSGAKGPVPNAARYIRVASDGASPSIMTREDFEALPPTIQRKYFSTLERLRFAQDSCLAYRTDPTSTEVGNDSTAFTRSDFNSLHVNLTSDLTTDSFAGGAPSGQRNISSSDLRFYANLPDKIKRRHLTEEEQLVAQRHRQSVILDAADEALIKLSRRQSQLFNLEVESIAPAPQTQEQQHFVAPAATEQDASELRFPHEMEGSLYESFRWLDEDEELDLRLYLDDYHINLRQEVPLLSNNHRPTFRRHLSVSKLPFGRLSTTLGRPDDRKDSMESPTAADGFPSPARRKSRALSLISPSKQAMVETPPLFDPTTAHYQDPEARMKLRVYLASPQKFDEAIEFGFPSMDDVQATQELPAKRSKSRQQMLEDAEKYCTFLEDGDDDDDDDASSAFTDGVSANDPDSPRTPELTEKPPVLRPFRQTREQSVATRGDYAHAPASSREMTLRMTLTRPDLRANEDQIYGWQKGAVARRARTCDGPSTLAGAPSTLPKQSFERSIPMVDHQCHGGICDPSVVKRIWNRVRRN